MKATCCRLLGFLLVFVTLAIAAGAQEKDRSSKKSDPAVSSQATDEEDTQTESGESTDRIDELERQIGLLAEEIEKLKLGEVAEEKSPTGTYGFAPSASKVYRIDRGVSIGGYGEAVFQDFSGTRDDGAASGKVNQFDFLRAIVYMGYKWNDRILFNSELEFEHASTGKAGEVSIEFAYLDFFVRPEVNFRAGLVLIPVGFINELHEPPVYYGATRPQVERVIIPTTWRENGGGAFGNLGPLTYRTYVVAGLLGSGFSSSSAIRGGRQKGSKSLADDFAWTGRVDLTSVTGLVLGGSFYIGNSGQGAASPSGESIDAPVDLFDFHAQYDYRGLRVRGLYASGSIGDVAAINRSLGLTGSNSIGSGFGGGYFEAGYDLVSLKAGGGSWALVPFFRYERYNTQSEVPQGFEANPANDISLATLGFDVKPHHSVVLKLEYQNFSNAAGTGIDQWNFALGYLF